MCRKENAQGMLGKALKMRRFSAQPGNRPSATICCNVAAAPSKDSRQSDRRDEGANTCFRMSLWPSTTSVNDCEIGDFRGTLI